MDLDTIVSDLRARFEAPLPEFYKRRIVFWHDPEGEWKDTIEGMDLPKAKLLVMNGTNNFAAKKLLTVEDTTSDYLVYIPFPYETEEDNWLLNLELYSEEFRADLISIWMKELDLPKTPDMIRVVKKYRRFLDSEERRKLFVKLSHGISRPEQMDLAVMASLCGCDDAKPENIVKAVILGGLDMDSNEIYQKFLYYGTAVSFWVLIQQATGYLVRYVDEDLVDPISIKDLLTHILLVATVQTLPKEYLRGLDRFIYDYTSRQQGWCYSFVSDWMEGNDKERLKEILREVEEELALRDRFLSVPLDDLLSTEVFPCIDECILTQLMTDISNDIINVEVIQSVVERRKPLAWAEEVSWCYEGISQVANMQQFFLSHSGGFHTVEAPRVWKEYTNDYYRMDTYYRKYHLAFGKSLMADNDLLEDLFKQVTDKVEGLYTHWFLGQLGENWSKVCADDLTNYGRILEVPQQVDFYDHYVKNAGNRMFVIISDALRYEVAVSLAEELRLEPQSKVEIESVAGIFPTVTKFGMAALLPHKELSIQEKNGGDLQILADGRSTDAGNRDKVLKSANRNSVALKYSDIAPMKKAERQALVKGMDVVYIYHDKIDEASHTSDSAVFPACNDAIEEIKKIVKIIRNEFSGTRVLITADHGFLYTYSPLSEDAKVDRTTLGKEDVEVDRRYLITRKGAKPDFLLPVKFMDENYDAFTPKESIRIKKKGGGLQFVHGGISLQEMVVPVISYHYVRKDSKAFQQNKAKYTVKPVELSLLSGSHKVTNMIFSLSFYQKETVGGNVSAASYVLYFEDAQGNPVSDKVKVIADKTSSNEKDRIFRQTFHLKSQKYSNREAYYLVIENESGLELPQREEFQIDIALAMDDFDFLS